jgi:hypothetical protein
MKQGAQLPFEEIAHAVYFGRHRLGRYVQTRQARFQAFDPDDRPLGIFKTRAEALAAIRDEVGGS